MSENNIDPNIPNKLVKSKLDLIWSELQTNLPSIDFNENSNESDEVI